MAPLQQHVGRDGQGTSRGFKQSAIVTHPKQRPTRSPGSGEMPGDQAEFA
jgi:hypothetical protein